MLWKCGQLWVPRICFTGTRWLAIFVWENWDDVMAVLEIRVGLLVVVADATREAVPVVEAALNPPKPREKCSVVDCLFRFVVFLKYSSHLIQQSSTLVTRVR